MRSYLFHILLVLSFVLFYSCSGQPESVENAVSTAPATTAEVKETTAQKDLKLLASLTKSPTATVFSIDAINEQNVAQATQPMAVSGDELTVAGWVVDEPNKTTANKIFVNIAGSDFPAAYGGERPDVAKALGQAAYTKSGFMSKIPVSEIGKGNHQLRLKVVAAQGDVYYLTDKVEIVIQ